MVISWFLIKPDLALIPTGPIAIQIRFIVRGNAITGLVGIGLKLTNNDASVWVSMIQPVGGAVTNFICPITFVVKTKVR